MVEDTRNDLLSALEDWLYVNAYVAHLELSQFDGISMAGPLRRVVTGEQVHTAR